MLESLMKVYLVMFEHTNGGGVMGAYRSKEDADEAAEDYQLAAEDEHSLIDFYIESYILQ